MNEFTHMTVAHMRAYLDSDRSHNAYVLVSMDDETALVELGIRRALVWLDEKELDETIPGAIIHGGTALRIGG